MHCHANCWSHHGIECHHIGVAGVKGWRAIDHLVTKKLMWRANFCGARRRHARPCLALHIHVDYSTPTRGQHDLRNARWGDAYDLSSSIAFLVMVHRRRPQSSPFVHPIDHGHPFHPRLLKTDQPDDRHASLLHDIENVGVCGMVSGSMASFCNMASHRADDCNSAVASACICPAARHGCC